MKKQSCFVVLLLLLLLFPSGAFAQQQMIKGQVVDDKGETIIGATVMVKGAKEGTLTDIDGNFSVKGKVGNTLSISYVGFSPLEVKVTKLEGNRFVLREDSKLLDEVVVVGMDKQKRNTITAAVSTVASDAIVNRPVTDLTSALQGNVAGLNFVTDAAPDGVGGETGAEIKFNIRGVGSINGNGGEPYVLVDGVEQSMQNVNPADIASISVLKDASASAVYGARAAYGVVLVTTKSGKKERASVTYRGTVGFSAPINMPKMMNALEYAAYNNQQYDNGGASSGLQKISDKTIEKIKGFMQNPYSAEFPGIEANTTGDDWAGAYYNQYGNTDWFEYYFKDKSVRHSHNLSVQGGSDKVNYYIGMGYTYQEGLLDKVQDDLSKYNLNTKLQFKTSDWLRFNLNNNITLQMIKRPMANQMILYNKIGSHRPTQVTELPVESEYNIPSWNEMLYLKNSNYQRNRISDALSFSATVTPLEGWDITGEMKIRFDVENNNLKMKDDQKYETPAGTFKPGDATNQRQGFAYPGISWKNMYFGSYTRGSMFNYYLSPNLSSSYTHQWGDHFFKAMAGYQMELQEYSEEYMYKDGMLSNDIYSFDNASGNVIAGEARSHWATMGFYTRLNWNYNNIYFLEFSGRYDGSSRFAPGHRWGFFPSASVGWVISNEKFMQNITPINYLKFRASIGTLGNERIGNYPYQTYISFNNAIMYDSAGSTPQSSMSAAQQDYAYENIHWEKTQSWDIGVDAAFFNNRLDFSADYYYKKTTDMLLSVAIPSFTGYSAPDRNVGKMHTRGWEVKLGWSDRIGDVNYAVSFNISDYKSIIDNLNGKQQFNSDGTIITEGAEYNSWYGYKTAGLFQTAEEVSESALLSASTKPGDVKYVDVSGPDGTPDGIINETYDRVVLGSSLPHYLYGGSISLGWKGLSFSLLFNGVGKQLSRLTESMIRPMQGQWLPAPSVLLNDNGSRNYWSVYNTAEQNAAASYPRLSHQGGEYNNYKMSDYWLKSSAYMRIKNINVGYTVPKKIVSKVGIKGLRVYVNIDDPYCFDSYLSGWDPEAGASTYITRTYTFGVDIKF